MPYVDVDGSEVFINQARLAVFDAGGVRDEVLDWLRVVLYSLPEGEKKRVAKGVLGLLPLDNRAIQHFDFRSAETQAKVAAILAGGSPASKPERQLIAPESQLGPGQRVRNGDTDGQPDESYFKDKPLASDSKRSPSDLAKSTAPEYLKASEQLLEKASGRPVKESPVMDHPSGAFPRVGDSDDCGSPCAPIACTHEPSGHLKKQKDIAVPPPLQSGVRKSKPHTVVLSAVDPEMTLVETLDDKQASTSPSFPADTSTNNDGVEFVMVEPTKGESDIRDKEVRPADTGGTFTMDSVDSRAKLSACPPARPSELAQDASLEHRNPGALSLVPASDFGGMPGETAAADALDVGKRPSTAMLNLGHLSSRSSGRWLVDNGDLWRQGLCDGEEEGVGGGGVRPALGELSHEARAARDEKRRLMATAIKQQSEIQEKMYDEMRRRKREEQLQLFQEEERRLCALEQAGDSGEAAGPLLELTHAKYRSKAERTQKSVSPSARASRKVDVVDTTNRSPSSPLASRGSQRKPPETASPTDYKRKVPGTTASQGTTRSGRGSPPARGRGVGNPSRSPAKQESAARQRQERVERENAIRERRMEEEAERRERIRRQSETQSHLYDEMRKRKRAANAKLMAEEQPPTLPKVIIHPASATGHSLVQKNDVCLTQQDAQNAPKGLPQDRQLQLFELEESRLDSDSQGMTKPSQTVTQHPGVVGSLLEVASASGEGSRRQHELLPTGTEGERTPHSVGEPKSGRDRRRASREEASRKKVEASRRRQQKAGSDVSWDDLSGTVTLTDLDGFVMGMTKEEEGDVTVFHSVVGAVFDAEDSQGQPQRRRFSASHLIAPTCAGDNRGVAASRLSPEEKERKVGGASAAEPKEDPKKPPAHGDSGFLGAQGRPGVHVSQASAARLSSDSSNNPFKSNTRPSSKAAPSRMVPYTAGTRDDSASVSTQGHIHRGQSGASVPQSTAGGRSDVTHKRAWQGSDPSASGIGRNDAAQVASFLPSNQHSPASSTSVSHSPNRVNVPNDYRIANGKSMSPARDVSHQFVTSVSPARPRSGSRSSTGPPNHASHTSNGARSSLSPMRPAGNPVALPSKGEISADVVRLESSLTMANHPNFMRQTSSSQYKKHETRDRPLANADNDLVGPRRGSNVSRQSSTGTVQKKVSPTARPAQHVQPVPSANNYEGSPGGTSLKLDRKRLEGPAGRSLMGGIRRQGASPVGPHGRLRQNLGGTQKIAPVELSLKPPTDSSVSITTFEHKFNCNPADYKGVVHLEGETVVGRVLKAVLHTTVPEFEVDDAPPTISWWATSNRGDVREVSHLRNLVEFPIVSAFVGHTILCRFTPTGRTFDQQLFHGTPGQALAGPVPASAVHTPRVKVRNIVIGQPEVGTTLSLPKMKRPFTEFPRWIFTVDAKDKLASSKSLPLSDLPPLEGNEATLEQQHFGYHVKVLFTLATATPLFCSVGVVHGAQGQIPPGYVPPEKKEKRQKTSSPAGFSETVKQADHHVANPMRSTEPPPRRVTPNASPKASEKSVTSQDHHNRPRFSPKDQPLRFRTPTQSPAGSDLRTTSPAAQPITISPQHSAAAGRRSDAGTESHDSDTDYDSDLSDVSVMDTMRCNQHDHQTTPKVQVPPLRMINVRVAQKRMRNHLELTLEETAKNAQHPKPGAGGNALGGKALEKREIKKINGVTLKQKAHGSTHSSKNGFKAPKRAKDVTPKQTNSPQHIPLQHTPDPESDRSHKSVHESLDQTHKTHGSSPPPKLDSFHSRPMSPANSIHEATVTSVHALSPSQQSQNYRQQQLQQQQHQQQQQKQSANGDATLKSDPMSSTHFQKGNKMGQTHGSTPYNPYQTVSTDPQDATLNQGSDLHFSHGSNLNDASLIGTRIGSNSNSNNSNTNHMNNNNNNNNHGNNNNNNDKKNTPSSQQPLPARTTPQAHPVTNTRSPQNPPKKVSDNKDGGCSCAVM